MKLKFLVATLILGLASFAGTASARTNVDIGVVLGGYPAPVYYEPAPVVRYEYREYYEPAPVVRYYESRPVYYGHYDSRPVYRDRGHHHHHHHRGRDYHSRRDYRRDDRRDDHRSYRHHRDH